MHRPLARKSRARRQPVRWNRVQRRGDRDISHRSVLFGPRPAIPPLAAVVDGNRNETAILPHDADEGVRSLLALERASQQQTCQYEETESGAHAQRSNLV